MPAQPLVIPAISATSKWREFQLLLLPVPQRHPKAKWEASLFIRTCQFSEFRECIAIVSHRRFLFNLFYSETRFYYLIQAGLELMNPLLPTSVPTLGLSLCATQLSYIKLVNFTRDSEKTLITGTEFWCLQVRCSYNIKSMWYLFSDRVISERISTGSLLAKPRETSKRF